MVDQPFKLSIEVFNTSNARFNVPELEVLSEKLEFQEENSTYVGDLDAGGSWNLDTMALATESGPVDVIVNVYYVDDLNQTQVISQTLSFEVQAMPDSSDSAFPSADDITPPTETFWNKVLRAVKGFFGLGG